MGCIFKSGAKRRLDDNKQGFLINIMHPQTKQPLFYKYYDEKQKSDLIMNVMNGLCFSEKVNEKVDGNFISIYDLNEDRFHYYVQRLLGFEIEDMKVPENGRMWVPYLNQKKQDWDSLVENNIRVSINDQILWRFELNKKDREKDYKLK